MTLVNRWSRLLGWLVVISVSVLLFACGSDGSRPLADESERQSLIAQRGAAPLLGANNSTIPGRYLVVLRDVARSGADAAARNVAPEAVHHVYERALKGFAAELSAADLTRVLRDPEVAYVEPDQIRLP